MVDSSDELTREGRVSYLLREGQDGNIYFGRCFCVLGAFYLFDFVF